VANFLIQKYGFQKLELLRQIETPKVEKSAEGVRTNGYISNQVNGVLSDDEQLYDKDVGLSAL